MSYPTKIVVVVVVNMFVYDDLFFFRNILNIHLVLGVFETTSGLKIIWIFFLKRVCDFNELE